MIQKREKFCENCKSVFYDITKRVMSRTCSKKCAYELGVKIRYQKGSYNRTLEQNSRLSKTLKEKYKNGWNPNTDEVVKQFVERMKKLKLSGESTRKSQEACMTKYGAIHHMKTEKYKLLFSEIFTGRIISIKTKRKLSISQRARNKSRREKNYTNANGGFRKDLGMYFRSGWEANYARILNYENKIWEYEPD